MTSKVPLPLSVNRTSSSCPLPSTYLLPSSIWCVIRSPSGSETDAFTVKGLPAWTAEASSTVIPVITGGVLSPEVPAPYAFFTA